MSTSSVGTSGAAIQFSGLASGLDTSSIISAMMSAESIPQTTLKNSVANEQSQVSELQRVNSAIKALLTSTDGFTTGSTWTQMAATSSNSAVTVSASASATPTNLAVSVLQVATAAELDFNGPASALSAVVATPTGDPAADVLNISLPDSSTAQVSIGDGKLSTIVANLNALKDTDGKPLLNASAVAVGNGQYSLLVTSATTGAGSLGITGPASSTFFSNDPANMLARAGTDAQIKIGAGLTLTSSTNTFTDVVSGVNVTVAPGTQTNPPTTSQISVADNGASRATAINAFVSQINSVVAQITQDTAYGSTTTNDGAAPVGGGILPGDSTLRGVASQLISTIFGNNTVPPGLSVDQDGNMTFDQDAFKAAYQADPQGVTDAYTGKGGFAQRVADAANMASDPVNGSVSSLIKSMKDQISQQNDEIADWDVRLAQKQANLEKTYSNLETLLSQMQSQQAWLSSSLSSLDGGWLQNS